jgi:hypothetical protein
LVSENGCLLLELLLMVMEVWVHSAEQNLTLVCEVAFFFPGNLVA